MLTLAGRWARSTSSGWGGQGLSPQFIRKNARLHGGAAGRAFALFDAWWARSSGHSTCLIASSNAVTCRRATSLAATASPDSIARRSSPGCRERPRPGGRRGRARGTRSAERRRSSATRPPAERVPARAVDGSRGPAGRARSTSSDRRAARAGRAPPAAPSPRERVGREPPAARPAAHPSSSTRTSELSARWPMRISLTSVGRLGTTVTRPSIARRMIASRIGVLLIPSSRTISSSPIAEPGGISRVTMRWRRSRYAFSASDAPVGHGVPER